MSYFTLLMETSLAILIILAKVMFSLEEVHLLGIFLEVAFLDQLNLMGSVKCLKHVFTMGPSTILLESVPGIG